MSALELTMMKRVGELNAEVKLLKSQFANSELENARLKAELTDCKSEADRFKDKVERLRKDEDQKDKIIQDFATNLIRLGNECRDWAAECKDLKSEVERLRKDEGTYTIITERMLALARNANESKSTE